MRQTFAYIDPKAVGRNLQQIRSIVGDDKHIMAVVKADAYGHGMLPIVAYNYASGNRERMKKTIDTARLLGYI